MRQLRQATRAMFALGNPRLRMAKQERQQQRSFYAIQACSKRLHPAMMAFGNRRLRIPTVLPLVFASRDTKLAPPGRSSKLAASCRNTFVHCKRQITRPLPPDDAKRLPTAAAYRLRWDIV